MTEGAPKSFYEIIEERQKEKGLSLFELAKLTSIPEGTLRRMFENKQSALPAGPYLRGYIMKIAPHIDIEGEELWKLYQKTHEIKTSGPEDELPMNRYAVQAKKRGPLLLGLLLIGLIVVYGIINGARLIGSPKLTVFFPEEESIIVRSPSVLLRGAVTSQDSLEINNEPVAIGADGTWSKEYSLEPGITTFEIKATRFLGRETLIRRQVIFEETATGTLMEQ